MTKDNQLFKEQLKAFLVGKASEVRLSKTDIANLLYVYHNLPYDTYISEVFLLGICITENAYSSVYVKEFMGYCSTKKILELSLVMEEDQRVMSCALDVSKLLNISELEIRNRIKWIITWLQLYSSDEIAEAIKAGSKRIVEMKLRDDALFSYISGILRNRRNSAKANTVTMAARKSSMSDEMLDELSRLFMEDVNRGV